MPSADAVQPHEAGRGPAAGAQMTTMRPATRPHGLAIACLLVAIAGAAADRPAVGDQVPLPILRDLRGGGDRSLKELAGRAGIVVVFWAGWSQRSVEELQRLDAAATEMAAHGVAMAAVNVDRQTLDDA